MKAQTVVDAKAGTPEGLLHFLAQVPFTQEAGIFYALAIGCSVGLVLHYTRRWATGDIAGSLFDYLFRQDSKRTFLSIFGIFTWSIGEVSAGLFVNDGVFVGWALVLISGLKTGYTGDSLLNKGERVVYTPEKRAQVIESQKPEPNLSTSAVSADAQTDNGKASIVAPASDQSQPERRTP